MRLQRLARSLPAALALLVGAAVGALSAGALADAPTAVVPPGRALRAPTPAAIPPAPADAADAIAPVAPVALVYPAAPPHLGGSSTPPPAPAPAAAPPDPAPAAAPPDPAPAAAFLFAGPAGPTPAGAALLRWLDDAPLHGVDLPTTAPLAAWRRDPATSDRAAAERALRDAALLLAAALPPRPSRLPVLADPDGNYLSPDSLWRGEAPPPPAPAPVAPGSTPPPVPPPAPPIPTATDADLPAAALDLDAFFTRRLPPQPEYAALVAAARRYRDLCAAGGWDTTLVVPKPKEQLSAKWKDAAAITALQRRLVAEGYYAGEPTGAFDEPTAAAVLAYRATHDLRDKAFYDAALAESLNIPCERRLATLTLNARRWRHTAHTTEPTYVRVNLAGARLRYVRDGVLKRAHRTVVGSGRSFISKVTKRRIRQNATPILHDFISNIVVNPEWTVPPRLVRQEIEPELAKDPTYLERKNFRVVTSANGTKMYIQGRGPGNALGQVKLAFPNSESVYLHDTPSKGYFLQPRRDYSHGCVRVQDALDLATDVLIDDYAKRGEVFSPGAVKGLAYSAAKTYWFALGEPIPVFLEYYTASVEEDGTVVFHHDIYDYDADTFAAAVAPAGDPAVPK